MVPWCKCRLAHRGSENPARRLSPDEEMADRRFVTNTISRFMPRGHVFLGVEVEVGQQRVHAYDKALDACSRQRQATVHSCIACSGSAMTSIYFGILVSGDSRAMSAASDVMMF